MTPDEIRDICELLTAAGRTHVPVPISEWREHMAATIKRADIKTDAKERELFLYLVKQQRHNRQKKNLNTANGCEPCRHIRLSPHKNVRTVRKQTTILGKRPLATNQRPKGPNETSEIKDQ